MNSNSKRDGEEFMFFRFCVRGSFSYFLFTFHEPCCKQESWEVYGSTNTKSFAAWNTKAYGMLRAVVVENAGSLFFNALVYSYSYLGLDLNEW
jgi:hypothetical protein